MAKNKGKKKDKDPFANVKAKIENNEISMKEIDQLSNINYPLFSFKYFDSSNLKNITEVEFLNSFLSRLNKLSLVGWDGIRSSHRHSLGMERIPRKMIKRDLPTLTPDVTDIDVFRATGSNKVFIGVQEAKIFHIVMLEPEFGTIYNH